MDLQDRYVVFRNGPALPADALHFVWDLEGRGFSLEAKDGALIVQPSSRLTDDDRAAIRRWRLHLLAIMQYVQRNDIDAHLRGD
jgi:hypothetical protein